jgi:hypothetical protein
VCQYFNVKTNKVAMMFNCNVDFQEKDGAASGATTAPAEEKKGGAADSIQKGLKGIFGK